jgi:4-amino-4-deoxy-L-arabinose transferase-like glycosyltransferase
VGTFAYDDELLQQGIQPVGRAPGYPLFLAAVGGGARPVDAVPAAVKVAQALVGAIGVVLVGMLAKRLAGPAAGLASALVAACYPPLVWISAYALSEAVTWPIGLALIWSFDRACERHWRLTPFAASGALAGLAALVRPSLLAFVPLALVWLLWRRHPAAAAVFAAGALLFIAPWAVRNFRQSGRLVLIAAEGGVTFWTGNHPVAIGEGDLAANPELARLARLFRAEHADLTEAQMEPLYYRDAANWIGRHPIAWLALEGRKLFYLVVPVGPSYRLHSTAYYTASVVSYGLLLPFAVGGVRRLGPRRALSPALWLLVGSSVLVALTFFPQERFRIPLIDPALIVCAGAFAGSKAGTWV